MRDLGTYDIIRDIPQMLSDGLQQQRKEHEMSGDEKAAQQRLSNVLIERFTEREITHRIRALLAKSYDGSRYSTLQRLLQSPIAKKLAQLKHEAYSDAAIAEISRIARDYDERKHEKERLTLIRQLDDVSADTEFFIAAQALSIHALARLRASRGDAALSNTDELLRQSYEQLVRPSRFTTTMTYLHIFKAQSLDDLRQFIDLYSFADVQWFLSKFMEALRTTLLQMTQEAEQLAAKSSAPQSR